MDGPKTPPLRDATDAEMTALREAVRAERTRTRIVLVAVLVFVVMGIGILWNLVAGDLARVVAIGVLVAIEMAFLRLWAARRASWEKRVAADWEAREVEEIDACEAKKRARFVRSGLIVSFLAGLAVLSCASGTPQRQPTETDLAIEDSATAPGDSISTPQADPVPGDETSPSARELPEPEIVAEPSERAYPWIEGEPGEPLWRRFDPPRGYARVATARGSFGNWLRHLPLKPGRPDVLLFDGARKGRQDVHVAVVDIDVGTRDLQQCVDACMRLRAEYLWSAGRGDEVCFRSVGGQALEWRRWSKGERPERGGWKRTAAPASGWRAFRAYLDKVFGTCNTRSQLEQMVPVDDPDEIEIGHVFLNRPDPDSYGHAVMVVDLAADATGRRAFLLAQSYMPAQEIHVLANPVDRAASPWYTLDPGRPLVTPEWTFAASDLVRYPDGGCVERP